jgi:hypothetical protein
MSQIYNNSVALPEQFTQNEQAPLQDAIGGDDQAFGDMLSSDGLEAGSLGDLVMKQFATQTNSIQQAKVEANKAIKAAVEKPSMERILESANKTNLYNEQALVMTKVITKGTQAIDQLTKLQ